jgi:hypothetical protein
MIRHVKLEQDSDGVLVRDVHEKDPSLLESRSLVFYETCNGEFIRRPDFDVVVVKSH